MQAIYIKISNVIMLFSLFLLVSSSFYHAKDDNYTLKYLKYIYILSILLFITLLNTEVFFHKLEKFFNHPFDMQIILFLMHINLIHICYIDLIYFRIPNLLLVIDCLIWICFYHLIDVNFTNLTYRMYIGMTFLLIGLIINLFWQNKIGFGDVKMIAVSCLWIDTDACAKFMFLIGLFGIITWYAILRVKAIDIKNAKAMPIPLAPAICISRIICCII